MSARTVDLVVPELHARDATSAHTRHLRDLLVSDGHRVRLVAERADSGDEFVALDRWRADADLTILQHSIGSAAADEIIRRRVPVVVNYHNVTPIEFVEPWEPREISGLRWGREQLWQLAPITRLAIAVSEYNAQELRTVGFASVSVAPVMFATLAGHDGACASSGAIGSGAAPLLLFVGRLSPNKCQQDLIAALAALRCLEGNADAELVLVGGPSSAGYYAALEAQARKLGVEGAVRFAGSVTEAELVGWYQRADVFVCLSEHEGFCVPIVEAMGFGVPVVAFAAAAVPETLADSGVILGDKSPLAVALAVSRVMTDADLRDQLVRRGRARAQELNLATSSARMRALVAPLLAEVGR